jgi:hypothetical protein
MGLLGSYMDHALKITCMGHVYKDGPFSCTMWVMHFRMVLSIILMGGALLNMHIHTHMIFMHLR